MCTPEEEARSCAPTATSHARLFSRIPLRRTMEWREAPTISFSPRDEGLVAPHFDEGGRVRPVSVQRFATVAYDPLGLSGAAPGKAQAS